MKPYILLLLVFASTFVNGQESNDSLKSEILAELVIQGVPTQGDTLQNFYRANASATTEHILSRMQGVSLMRRGAYGQEPVFRGLSSGQLNITLDGMKIFGACTDKMDPVTIYVEPANLSAIQAIMGPQGSRYGSTIGGSLNMKLAEPVVGAGAPVSGQAGLDLQSSAQSISYFSSLNLSKQQSAYRASVTYRKNNNYHSGGNKEVEYSQYEKINLSVGGKWSVGHDTLQADIVLDEGRNIGFAALPMDVGKATAGIYSLTYNRVVPWGLLNSIKAKMYHNHVAHSMDDTHRSDVVMHMDMPGRSATTGMYIESNIHVFHEHQTVLKLEYFRNSTLGEMTMYPEEGSPMYMQTSPKASRQNAGVYFHQQFRFNRNNKLLVALRTDLFSDRIARGIGIQQWQVFNPDISTTSTRVLKNITFDFSHNISSTVQWKIQGGYGERIPTMNERVGFYLFNKFDGYDYLGNPNLKNEQSWNIESTISWFGSKVELQWSPFYQKINNYAMGISDPDLSVMTIGAKGVKINRNIGTATLAGADLMILANPAPSVQLITIAKYTYGSTKSGTPLPLIPPLKIVASVQYTFTKTNVQVESEWSSPQSRVNNSTGEQRTPGFLLVSLRTQLKINSRWQCSGGIENIFDRSYREHLDWGGILRPGRNFYVNLIHKFKRK